MIDITGRRNEKVLGAFNPRSLSNTLSKGVTVFLS